MDLTNYNIILGSSSVRRIKLLTQMGFKFTIIKPNIKEFYPSTLKNYKITSFISECKSKSIKNISDNDILITADTIVCQYKDVFLKPKNILECKNMLRKLSGKRHNVYTSVTLRSYNKIFTFHEKTKVEFINIPDDSIDYYIQKFNPLDKCGGYGIQEWISLNYVKKINGSFTNILGLPTCSLYKNLINFIKI